MISVLQIYLKIDDEFGYASKCLLNLYLKVWNHSI